MPGAHGSDSVAVPGNARRAGLGAMAGILAGLPVVALMSLQDMAVGTDRTGLGVAVPFLVYSGCAGAVIGLVAISRFAGVAVAACGGLLVGLLGWLLFWLTVDPLVHGHAPTWTIAGASGSYPALVGSLLQGASAAVLALLLLSWAGRNRAGDAGAAGESGGGAATPRVVIVGGGFAGLAAARRFERLSLRGRKIDVTLISESNFLLFTPMLAEVASGALEPSHISAPIRASAAHTRFRHGAVDAVDMDARTVRLAGGSDAGQHVFFDHLVVAVGSTPHFLDLPGVETNARTLKDLSDAIGLRDHVVGLMEQADHVEPDPLERERLLTFVVAGGGFAGTETVAELFDLVHGVLHFFPGISPEEPRFVLVHSREQILPELSARLGEYALERLRARGIEFRLGVRVVGATDREVRLDDGTSVPTRTFVWTAGTRPSELVRAMAGDHARNGALITDSACRVKGLDRVWALGDCAQVPDVDTDGAPFPPTAQHASRQGKALADNVAAVLAGQEPTDFRFRALGLLVALGHRTAAAEIRGRQFSGLAAWLLWRGIYLAKLPGIEKRIRVLLDWLLDLVFPRDIVLTSPRSPVGAGSPRHSRPASDRLTRQDRA